MKRAILKTVCGLALACATLSPATAKAAWLKAETDRFIVYGDVDEATVREYAVKLSTFDKVLHAYNPRAVDAPPPRKFEVYLLRQSSGIQRIAPKLGRDVAGFYDAASQAEFAVAVIEGVGLSGDTVLFHEYAHHFMFANFPAAYPTWFVEGWAEYFGNTEVTPTGVKVGGYNEGRVAWLSAARWIPWDEVLGRKFRDIRDYEQPLYYPQAWLFVHYMMSDKARAEQLNKITAAIANGEDPVKAVKAVTGLTMPQLNHALQGYTRLQFITLKNFRSTAPVTVSRLPASADDLLLDSLRLSDSGPGKPNLKFLADVRKRAAKYPSDALAEQTLALAEFVYGDVTAGEALVGRRLAAHPDEIETLRIAGVGQIMAGERNPAAKVQRYRAARPFLIKAYGLDKTDFRTLFAYAFSRTVEPEFPNDNDLTVLDEASGLAPSAEDISLLAGDAFRRRGRQAEAKRLLSVVANNPHGGDEAEEARALLAGGAPLDLGSLTLIGEDTDEGPKKPPPPKPPSNEKPKP